MPNFWNNLKSPIFCLAPMEEVTDYAFREMFARYTGNSQVVSLRASASDRSNLLSSEKIASSADKAPTSAIHRRQGYGGQEATAGKLPPRNDKFNNFVMFTEFVNVDGLLHPEGFEKLKIDLKYSEAQRPIVAQIWGRDPEKFFLVAQMLVRMGFDGIDINFGCPQAKEIAGGTCAALIREPKLAQEIISATKKGARRRQGYGGQAGDLPVSVKTRLAYSKLDEMESWVRCLLQTDIAALTLHARSKQEMSKVPAHWDKIGEAVKIRNEFFKSSVIARSASDEAILSKKGIATSADKAPTFAIHRRQGYGGQEATAGKLPPRNDTTLIIGNGDIKTREEGLARIAETGCDGVMIARGAFGNPWLFRADNYQPNIKERLSVMLEHAELFDQTFKNIKSFAIMRKHFKAYSSGFPGAHELRAKLMETKNFDETKKIVEEYSG